MRHIKKFLESISEDHLDLLEYFLDLEDKYEIDLRPPSPITGFSTHKDYSIGIYFNHVDFVKGGYESKKVVLDIWNCISMVKSIGEFENFHFSGEDYAEIKWGFEIPYSDDASYNSSRQNRLMDSGSRRWRTCTIGDKEFSNYDNLLSKVRSVTKTYLKSTIHGPLSGGRSDFQRLLNIGDIEYIEGDFGDDLIVNNFYIRFRKI